MLVRPILKRNSKSSFIKSLDWKGTVTQTIEASGVVWRFRIVLAAQFCM